MRPELSDGGATPGPAVPTTVEELVRVRLTASVGGWRGLLDSALPPLAFLVAWLLTQDVRTAVGASIAVLVVALVARIARRETIQFTLGGIVTTALAAFIATRTGRAQDVFLPGILINSALAVVFAVSMVARWPVVGFVVGAVAEQTTAWREDRAVLSLSQKLTGLLLAGYVIRVAAQLPLYLAGNTTALAVVKLAVGWPLLVLGVFVAGAMLLRGRTPLTTAAGPPGASEGPADPVR